MYKVSVIIPVYKAEKYIERCVRSLFEQTLSSIEFIFVDDKTPDASITIIKRLLDCYPHRKKQVTILEMPKNSGQAAARSVGLSMVRGEYIIHCDPDDWVDLGYYEDLYNKAIEGDHDLVTADIMYHFDDNKQTPYIIKDFKNTVDILKSDSFYSFSLCNQLIKSDLIHRNNIDFYSGINYSEDFGFNARVYFYAKSVGHVHNVYYHYNKTNVLSITNNQYSSPIVRQRIKCLEYLDQFFRSQNVDIKEFGLLQRSKRDVKDIFLKRNSLNEWKNIFPEVCEWIIKRNDLSYPYRIVYWLSHKIGVWPMKIFLSVSNFKLQ